LHFRINKQPDNDPIILKTQYQTFLSTFNPLILSNYDNPTIKPTTSKFKRQASSIKNPPSTSKFKRQASKIPPAHQNSKIKRQASNIEPPHQNSKIKRQTSRIHPHLTPQTSHFAPNKIFPIFMP